MSLGSRSDFLYLSNLRPKKILNFLKAVFLAKKPRLSWFPLTYIIDPSTVCNLRCPFCYHGNYDPKVCLKNEMLSYKNFLKIFNKIKDYALMIYLYNYGESFLNPDTPKMLKTCTAAGIRCRISSNLAFKMTDKLAKEIVQSGLYRLTCSIDGPNQEIYGKYRQGGDVERVFANMRKLIAYKKQLKIKTPYIYYRMLVFEWNYKYVEAAKRKAKELGVDGFYAEPGRYILRGKKVTWDMKNKCWREIKRKRNIAAAELQKAKNYCPWLFKNMVIGANGKNLVCCFVNQKAQEHLSLLDHSLAEVWNSREYQKSRAYTLGLTQDRTGVLAACLHCRML